MLSKVLEFIHRHNLISPGEKILVGISGGPDSVCLLALLKELQKELGIELVACHLNHRLRKEAEEESLFVQSFCLGLNIPLILEERDVAGYRKTYRLSLEEAARLVRYDFFRRAALSSGAGKVAVAHTADDQVETILLNLLRGTGLRGLAGMSPISYRDGLAIIRPLLEISRKETEEYCRSHGLKFIQDPSNLDLRFRRNFLRHKVIPLLLKLNPRFKESLLATSSSLRRDLNFIEGELKPQEGIVTQIKDSLRIDRESWLKLPPALQAHLLLRLGEGLGVGLGAVHIEEAMKTIKNPGKRLDLPRGLKLFVEHQYAWLTPSSPPCPYPELKEFKLDIPGLTVSGGWRVEAEVVPVEKAELSSSDPFIAHLDWEKSGEEIFIRPRLPGDRFHPLGLKGEKKLQDFMVDAKIPRSWRGKIPVVVSDKHILWLVGYRLDDRVKVTPQTRQVLVLKFSPLKMIEREQALRLLLKSGCQENVIEHCQKVAEISMEIVRSLQKNNIMVDLGLIEAGALLHDIGRSKTHDIHHVVIGAEIARKEKLPEPIIRIIERHAGGGITAEEAEKLGWPPKSYLPETMEEKVVCYADKLVEGKERVSIFATLKKLAQELGDKHPALDRIKRLHEEFLGLI